MQPAVGASEPSLRTVEQWRVYLAGYGADILRMVGEDYLSTLSDEQLATGWLGFQGADEERLTGLERRLGTRLPPSYRGFLGASDGWLRLSCFMWEMGTADTVAWQQEVFDLGGDFDDEEFAQENAVLERALLIGYCDVQYWLLDPGDVSADGEWAAYTWEGERGLGERHASFAALVRAERAGFERLTGYRATRS